MRPTALWVAVSVSLVSACSASGPEAQPSIPTQQADVRAADALECDDEARAAGVLDHAADHVGEPTPEQAAATEVPPQRLARDGLTRRRTSDRSGALFMDYLDGEGRLVLSLRMQQQPDGTWVVGQTSSCARYSRG